MSREEAIAYFNNMKRQAELRASDPTPMVVVPAPDIGLYAEARIRHEDPQHVAHD